MNSFALVVPACVGLLIVVAIANVIRLFAEMARGLREDPNLSLSSRLFGYGFMTGLILLALLLGVGLYMAVEAVVLW